MNKKAIILLSGGLDSAVTLYWAKSKGYKCYCLLFDYGQRHKKEIECAKILAKKAKSLSRILKISLPWKGSSLLDKKINIPISVKVPRCQGVKAIPSTYIPGRNIIFLSFALSFAEAIRARDIFIGVHSQDYSNYPDCREEFYRAFRRVISAGTKTGVEKQEIKIKTPLIQKTKAQIIRLGAQLDVPFRLTWSCYQGGRHPCERCDSCQYRAKGFAEAGIPDPLLIK
ncbi:MAG: 7-cyano-7-deazaguanine synthase QueC [Candidatus Omnitrophica bacterium]|nr:7-cyano-7-deazaguanine synthase QueC [Candidatus Omnitrophota bacterium]